MNGEVEVTETGGRRPSRRQFLGMVGGTAALGALGGGWLLRGGASSAAAGPAPLGAEAILAAKPSSRALVVIELAGGNDGLATLAPLRSSTYAALRRATGIPADEAIRVTDDWGLNPGLKLTAPALAVVQGLGAPEASESHFEMSARWWSGDASGHGGPTTGFLGRLSDVLDAGAPVTGVSLAGVSPTMLSDKAVTMGLPGLDDLQWLVDDEDPFYANLRAGFAGLGAPVRGDAPATVHARTAVERSLRFAKVLEGASGEDPAPYPGSDLGNQLKVAAALLGSGEGIRVVHAQLGGFDTHSGQRGQHDNLMQTIDEALAAFAADLSARGLRDSVLVATTSEFGRRLRENDSGTDHGTASCALLMGPVHPGLHGEPLDLARLDRDDNLVPTASFESYYAVLAQEWFGIDAKAVLPSKPAPIAGVLNA